jgi:CRP/FNR family transcriptional regulator, cyclic AMP receptor protein
VIQIEKFTPGPTANSGEFLDHHTRLGEAEHGAHVSAIEELRKVAFWADALTEAEAARALKGISERRFPAGGYICHRGDKLDYWIGVISGLVKISAISADGKAMTFAGGGAGGWIGEGTVLKNEERKYDLVALRDTHLAMMNRATFMWLFDTSVGFTRFLVRQLNERMGQFIATIECDRIHDPTARVARNLSWLFNPVLYPNAKNHIEITQEELALLAGVSRQVANKALLRLEAEGLLVNERGGIRIVDLERLSRFEG